MIKICIFKIRKCDENIKNENGFWFWNDDRFTNNGLLCKSFRMCDIVIQGVIPTVIETRRFGQLKPITVNYHGLNYFSIFTSFVCSIC